MMRMCVKLLKRIGIGFLLGMLMGNIIEWITYSTLDNIELAEILSRWTQVVAFQTLIYGLYGAAAMGGTMLYEIESWPLALSSIAHYLIIAVLFVPMALLLKWTSDLSELLIMEGMEFVGYFLIWLIIYLNYRKKIRELNTLHLNRMKK